MELSKELSAQRDIDRAAALATHYFDFLDEEGVQIDITELSRAPELIRNIPLVHLGFASHTAERLCRTLLREDVPEFIHVQVASALTVLAQSIAAFEDFQNVLTIGVSLETSQNRNPEKHKKCCSTGLSRLLPPAAIERITIRVGEDRRFGGGVPAGRVLWEQDNLVVCISDAIFSPTPPLTYFVFSERRNEVHPGGRW